MKNFLNKIFYQNKKIKFPKEDIWRHWISDDYNKCENKEKLPEIIWTYWHDKELPNTVELCIQSWKKNNPNYKINILNSENLYDFITFKKDIKKLKNKAHQSDIIRLEILNNYGGIWLDATVFLNSPLKEIIYYKNLHFLDLICFTSNDHQNESNFPIIENWFLITSKKNVLIEIWLNEIYNAIDYSNPADYFKQQYLHIYYSIYLKNRDYLYAYMASQVAMRMTKNIKIGFLDSEVNGFFYNYTFKYNYDKIAKYLLLDTAYPVFPSVIKLISKNRKPIDDLIGKGVYNKNSMFGKYLK